MSAHIRAAAYGALAGATLGAPLRGRKGFRKLDFFEPIPSRMAQSEALEAWLVWSRHVRAGKSPQTISQSMLANWNYPIDESAFGLANASKGLGSPISGSFANPLPTGSQAIGRAIYWGLAFHGKPDEAAEHAYYDASVDHAGDGVWAPVALARVLALSHPQRSLTDIVRIATASLPKESRIVQALPLILQSLSNPDGAREIRQSLPAKLGLADPLDAVLSACWVLVGLLRGNGDFETSVLVTAGCGGASGQSTLACGAIAGALSGKVPEPWIKPLGREFVCGHGLRSLDPPKTVEEFVGLVVHDSEQYGAPGPAATQDAVKVDAPADADEPDQSFEMSDELRELLVREPNESITELEGLRMSVQFIDPPIVRPGNALRMSLKFTNIGDAAAKLATALSGPEDWEIATKLSTIELEPGESSSFAAVVKPPAAYTSTFDNLRLKVNKYELLIPLFGSQLWYHVGPFVNHEGAGFDRQFPAETKIMLGEVFNGRSDLPVEWSAEYFPGVVFDVEPLFKTGPGVLYLYASARFESPGKYRIIVASGVGVIVWINGEKLLWYHDPHTPVPRPTTPYLAEFATEGEVTILVKTLRNLPPVPALSIYFLAEDGSLATPVDFQPMKAGVTL
ncbi:MAG: ADP-ribosylglycohydrolase family protein [Armatimonadetes bacterium]|nr:ADP-ribosylglycohydrolase family protein [Armatimonadota bacterium]